MINKIMFFLDDNVVLGGAAYTLIRQAVLLKNAGHNIFMVYSCKEGAVCEAYERLCKESDISLICSRYPVSSQPEDIDIISIFENYHNVKKLILKLMPDILHSVQLNPIVELVSRELGIPHVMNIYQATRDFFAINYIDIFPKYHICDSVYYARRWAKYFHTDSVCIRTFSERIREFSKLSEKVELVKYICVGSVYKEKNQLSVIKAFQKALKDGIKGRMDIYGYCENAYGQTCKDYINKNHLEKWISLKGFCADLSEIYKDSDVLICGSTRESYPNVISEALANCVTVISTPVAGVPEVIKDRVNGYLCDDYTPDAIYVKIKEFNCDLKSGHIKHIMSHADETYWKEHSEASVTERLNSYYQNLRKNYVGKETVSIEWLKKKFEPWIVNYNENKDSFPDKDAVRKKIWYMFHILNNVKRQIEEGKEFYIWGTGKFGDNVYSMLPVFFPQLRITGFIDSFKKGHFKGYNIFAPEKILKGNGIILIGMFSGQHEVIDMIKSYKKKYNEDYYILALRYW